MKKSSLFIIAFSILLLAGCDTYKIEVDLPTEEIADISNEINLLKEEIAVYTPTEDNPIPWAATIDLSLAYEELGELGRAIEIYEDVINDGHATKAILHNLGRLYEKTGQFDKAVASYEGIVNEYFDEDYLYDITWAYIRAGDRKNAEKYFNAWQLEFSKTDEQTQQAIKKLREQEKGDNQ